MSLSGLYNATRYKDKKNAAQKGELMFYPRGCLIQNRKKRDREKKRDL